MIAPTDQDPTRASSKAQSGWPWLGTHEPFPELAGFRPVLGECGMVSSPHAAATAIGRDVLMRGGNAVDAAIATSAALMVTSPMQGGPGGDAFWMIASGDGAVVGLDASGRAPARADAAALRAQGLTHIPPRSAHAITVPGAIDGWGEAHRRFGSRPLDELLEPAALLAERGTIVSRHLRASFAVVMPDLVAKGAQALWELGSAAPELYARLRQPALASTLRQLGRLGAHVLYEGDLAMAIVQAAICAGSPLTLSDLAAHRSEWISPIARPFRNLVVHTTPPSTQGFALLAALAFVESQATVPLDVFDPTSVHLMIEACQAALHDRDVRNGDREHLSGHVSDCWSPERVTRFAQEFDADRSWRADGSAPRRITRGDTAYLAVVDREGMAVSLIQSLFFDFGSCVPVPSGGFTLQNRGAAFDLEGNGPGALRPGTRPPSTLMPSVVTRDGRLHTVLGCMGGDGQMQTQLQILLDLADGGLDPQQAVSRPRWYLDRANLGRPLVVAERGISSSVLDGLQMRNHAVEVRGPSEDIMGHAQVISVIPGGALIGAADPRSDGQAAAF